MGFFSWKTADSKESIANRHSPHFKGKPVYLLRPGGQPPIEETAYEGYGVFGDVDVNIWLAENNLQQEALAAMDDEARRQAGIMLDCGEYVLDRDTGKTYTIFHPIPFMQSIEHLGVAWDTPLEQFDGKSPNALIKEGRFVAKPLPAPVVPLKFSFREGARYEDLPASEVCPQQGYFYD